MEPKPSSTDGTQTASPNYGAWIFPVLLAILLLGLILAGRWAPDHTLRQQAGPIPAWMPTPQPVGETVRLSIDFGNGAQKEFAALPWTADMTVADLLLAAREFRPSLQFAQIGTGESGFLSSLDGLANEGAGGRNWLYRVDNQHAHVSFCLEKIEPGMHILWKFTTELYNDGAGE